MKHRKPKLFILKLPLNLQTTIPLLAKILIRSKASTDKKHLD